MSLLPYAFARPILFNMDPEKAHEFTMDMLAKGQRTPLSWAWCNQMVSDPIQLAGLNFPNRVGMAAGLDKNARVIDGLAPSRPRASPATPSRACSVCRRPTR